MEIFSISTIHPIRNTESTALIALTADTNVLLLITTYAHPHPHRELVLCLDVAAAGHNRSQPTAY